MAFEAISSFFSFYNKQIKRVHALLKNDNG